MANEFYGLCQNGAALDALTATNLSIEPHPTEFHEEFEIVATSGDGHPVGLGAIWCIWTWQSHLSATEWDNLFTLSGIGTTASANVFIRTRTNEIAGGKYVYRKYSAIMHRPEGETVPPWRFTNVSIKFTKMVVRP